MLYFKLKKSLDLSIEFKSNPQSTTFYLNEDLQINLICYCSEHFVKAIRRQQPCLLLKNACFCTNDYYSN